MTEILLAKPSDCLIYLFNVTHNIDMCREDFSKHLLSVNTLSNPMRQVLLVPPFYR